MALTDDVFNITQALLAIPIVFVNLAMLLGGAAYLGWLSWKILLGACGLILIGAVVYRLIVASAFHCLNSAREEEDRLFTYFRALTEGIKELKLHRNRRGSFLTQNVQTATENFQRHNVGAEIRFVAAQNWSHFLFFALIGLILFLLPAISNLSPKTLTGYVITTLYLMGPLAGVMSSLSLFGRANVALEKVEQPRRIARARQHGGVPHRPERTRNHFRKSGTRQRDAFVSSRKRRQPFCARSNQPAFSPR